MKVQLKRLLILVGAGGLLAWGVYAWRESRDYLPAQPLPKRAERPPQPITSSREEPLPTPNRPLSELKQVDSGPGVIVCSPVLTGKSDAGDFGDGCSHWLDVVVSGQVEFGKSPTLNARDWAVRILRRPDLRLPAGQAPRLSKALGITHAVLGEIAPAGSGYTLTYRLLDLNGSKPVGEPIRLTGSKQQIVALLPGAATELCRRLGAKSPQVPKALKEGPAELARLAVLLRGLREGPQYSKAIEKLGYRSTIANLHYAIERGNAFAYLDVRINQDDLYRELGANTLIYAAMAGGQEYGKPELQTGDTLKDAKNNYLVQFGNALSAALRKDYAGATTAAEQAVCCSLHSPEAWAVLGNMAENQAGALRKGRFVNQMTRAEMAALEPSYSRALQAKQRAAQLDPENDVLQLELSKAATFGGEPKLAAQALWRSIALQKGNPDAYIWGLDLFSQKWYGDEKNFQKIVRMALQDTYPTPNDRVRMAVSLFTWNGKAEGMSLLRSPEERAAAIEWGRKNQPALFKPAAAARPGSPGGAGSSSAKSTCVTSHTYPVTCLAWSPDGKALASGSRDNTVQLWSKQHELHRELLGHTDSVRCVAWSPDGKLVASGSDDKVVRVWRAATGEEIHAFRQTDGAVTALAWHPDGGKLAVADSISLRIIDLGLGKVVSQYGYGAARGAQLAWRPDGKVLALARLQPVDGKLAVIVWDPDAKKEVHTLDFGRNQIQCLAWSPDGKQLATGGDATLVHVFDAETGAQQRQFGGHEGAVLSLAWRADGRYLASGDAKNVIRLWEPATGLQAGIWRGHTDAVTTLAWNPTTGKLYSGSKDRSVLAWDGKLAPGKPAASVAGAAPSGPPLIAHPEDFLSLPLPGPAFALAIAPGGEWVAIKATAGGPANGSAALLDTRSGKEIRQLTGKSLSVSALAVSADGHWVAGGGLKGLTVWDAQTGAVRWEASGDSIRVVTFSPDGRYLASSDINGEVVVLRDAATGKQLRTLTEEGRISDLKFSRDSRQLAVGVGSLNRWGDISLWDPATGVRRRTLEGHTGLIANLAYSPDGKSLVSASADGTARVWDASTGRPLRVFGGSDARVVSAAFGSDSRTLLTTQPGSQFKIWDLAQGLRQVVDTGGNISGRVTYSAGGKVLALTMNSASGKGGDELRIWRLP